MFLITFLFNFTFVATKVKARQRENEPITCLSKKEVSNIEGLKRKHFLNF